MSYLYQHPISHARQEMQHIQFPYGEATMFQSPMPRPLRFEDFQRPYEARIFPVPQYPGQQQIVHWQVASKRCVPEAAAEEVLSIPRGPPLKPKQSGYALWVGNLPAHCSIESVKDHFSDGATQDIESVFLISRSNCAFVNYRTQAGCNAAIKRFHTSRLGGNRLSCRMRRSSSESESRRLSMVQSDEIPPSKTSMSPSTSEEPSSPLIVRGDVLKSTDDTPRVESTEPAMAVGDETHLTQSLDVGPKVPEKFFILKSLTKSDLEASVRCSYWTLQPHNVAILNKAWREADVVYLIFSANKSGEYFGYARLASAAITPSERKDLEKPSTNSGPQRITTPATNTAPPGVIVDDSVRGIMFWEAVDSECSLVATSGSSEDLTPSQFAVEWLSTTKLPFYATRGLRNSLNGNQEVKIARDGTELHPQTGKSLVNLFHTCAFGR